MYGWNGSSWVWGVVMMAVMVGIAALFVWAIVRARPGERRPDAMEILEERFARGEIDQEELDRRRQVLQKR